jgi:2-polyprenyl-6-methoxyphenol hydroxylase-like FAD-dependent oxidoreductase
MRKILIVGAGQSGLQLAIGLQTLGHEISLISNRTPDEIRAGQVMSTQCMFHSALQHERDLGINFWEDEAPCIEGLGVSVAAPDGSRPSTGSAAWTPTPNPSTRESRWPAGSRHSPSAAAISSFAKLPCLTWRSSHALMS